VCGQVILWLWAENQERGRTGDKVTGGQTKAHQCKHWGARLEKVKNRSSIEEDLTSVNTREMVEHNVNWWRVALATS